MSAQVSVSPVLRSFRTPLVRTISQVLLRLERAGPNPFLEVQREIMEWVRRKAGKALPREAWDGRSFELDDIGAQRAAAVLLEEFRYWAARVDDADRNVPQRTWTTEIGLSATQSGDLLFGCRLLMSARGENPQYQPSIPIFVRDVVSGGAAYLDGRLIGLEPWIVHKEEEVGQLGELITSGARRSDICVFSLPSDDPERASALAELVHSKTLGAAHIAVLAPRAAFHLTDLFGKEFSVFNGAVRTYRPNFDADIDDPFRHPMAMPATIVGWQEGGIEGPEAFEAFIVRNLISQTVAASDVEQRLPPFAEVRRAAASIDLDKAREAGATTDQLLKLYEEDNVKLRAALEEEKSIHSSLLEVADGERDEAQRRAEEAKGEVYRLNQRIRSLEAQLGENDGGTATSLPRNLEGLKEWADEHLSGSIVLNGRALRGAKASEYEEPTLVYRALLLLRDFYVPMRRAGSEKRSQRYEAELTELGLEEERSISPTRLGEQGDEYFIQHKGKRRPLDRHLRRGNSREPRHCFRLYYLWDEEDKQVVVGWMTSHLETRQS